MAENLKFGYVRCSKREQRVDGHSIDFQKAKLMEAGVDEKRIYEDVCSGKTVKRDGFDELMRTLRSGDTLVVYRFDRIGRNTKHLLSLVEEFQERGIEFVSLQENVDTTTPNGKLFFTISAAYAEFERSLLVSRTKDGLEAARKKGHYGGRPKVAEKSVKRMLKQYHSGDYSVREVAAMNNVSVSTLYKYVDEEKKARGEAQSRDTE